MAADRIAYEGLHQTFLEAFPEFTEPHKLEFDYWDDWKEPPGIYLVLGVVVFPRLVKLLDIGTNVHLVRRLFEFFERMATSDDRNVVDVLGLEVIQKLVHDPDRLRKAWPHMGVRTRDLTRESAKALSVRLDVG